MLWYKRSFDIALSTLLVLLLSALLLILALAIKFSSSGPVFHRSRRVGRNNQLFVMLKFRSMWINTPQLPTHLLSNSKAYLTPIGSFLRRSSFDELPQLWNILVGDMSFVGPRPALFNQSDLVALRTELGVHLLVPGLTGWAQVNGRDELPIPKKARLDAEYLNERSFWLDLKILAMTAWKVVEREGVSH